MKKTIWKLLLPIAAFSLSSCAFMEMANNQKNSIDLGDGDTFVKWSLVENNNEYRPVESAYFEINKDTIRYFENGELKKEGEASITYHGLDDETRPLTIAINFGYKDHLRIYDELICFTEDTKEEIHQFTIMAEGYHIKPLRQGGVPIRDYHLSEMPYAFGTYVKEESEYSAYKNSDSGKVGDSTKLKGTFVDSSENKFYFLNNCFYNQNGYYFSSSNVYFRYENHAIDDFIEGTIRLTWIDSYEYGRRVNYALLRIMHGTSEPSEQKGVVLDPDYRLVDFNFSSDTQFSFTKGEYFYDNKECSWDPAKFVPGTYTRLNNN